MQQMSKERYAAIQAEARARIAAKKTGAPTPPRPRLSEEVQTFDSTDDLLEAVRKGE